MSDSRRISKQQWVYQNEDKLVDNLSEFVGIVTGQNMNYSEAWQVNSNATLSYSNFNRR